MDALGPAAQELTQQTDTDSENIRPGDLCIYPRWAWQRWTDRTGQDGRLREGEVD